MYLKSVRSMMKTLGIDQEITELTSATTSASSSTEKKNKQSRTEELSINDVVRSFGGKAEGSSDDEDFDPLDEIHDYMKKKIVFPKNGDILKWWQDHSIIYKLLSRLALGLLPIPASSAASERIFSETSRTLETRRQLLSPDSLDTLVFLRHCL